MYVPKPQPARDVESSEEPRDVVTIQPAVRRQPAAAGPYSLLVTHNDARARGELSEMLRQLGYEVTCAGSAQEATAGLLQRQYDVMLCDPPIRGQIGIELPNEL